MDRALIGYQGPMRFKSFHFAPALLVSATIALGLAACGSDDDNGGDSGTAGSDLATKSTNAAGTTGSTGKQGNSGKKNSGKQNAGKQGGEVVPGKKAPDSAKDKGGKAPDDAISNRPGGPKPVSP
jgi:hypothetical protein